MTAGEVLTLAGKKPAKLEEQAVSAVQLAKVLDLSAARIGQLADNGILKRCEVEGTRREKYALLESVTAYIRYLRKQKPEVVWDEQEYKAEKLAKLKAQRELAELKVSEQRGDLHRTADIERVVGNMIVAFRSKVLALPSVAAPQLVEQRNEAAVFRILSELVRDVCVDLAAYDPAQEEHDTG